MLTKGCHRTFANMLRYVGCSRSDNRDEISRSENVRCRGRSGARWDTPADERKEAGPGGVNFDLNTVILKRS